MKSVRERFNEMFWKGKDETAFWKYEKSHKRHLDFIEQELNKEREEIIEWIEKQDWECFEQTFITKDIINTIKNRYEQSTNRTK